MKINRLDTHDRLLEFQKQWETISQGVVDCIKNVPDAITFPFYIFAHPRTIDEEEKKSGVLTGIFLPSSIPSTRMLYIPRITKPKVQTNSYLFMAYGKHSDMVKIIWLLPPCELWKQLKKGKMTSSQDACASIDNYLYARHRLEEPEKDGPTPQNQLDFAKIFAYEAYKRKVNKQEHEMIEKLYQSGTKTDPNDNENNNIIDSI